VELYDDIAFVVLKPIRYVEQVEEVDVAEIALFVGGSFVVTVRHGDSDVLGRVRRELDDGGTALFAHGPTGVLYRTMDLAVDGYEEAIACIDQDVDEIEMQVFGDQAEDHSERIYKLKREIAEFHRAMLPLRPALERLASGEIHGIAQSALTYFRDVHDHLLRGIDHLEGHDRLLTDVLQANLSRVAVRQSEIALRQNDLAMRQNEDMRKISAWAAIGLVPTAIAGVYGMNFDNMPELRWKYGYFVVVAVIIAVCTGLHRLFHRNGWL